MQKIKLMIGFAALLALCLPASAPAFDVGPLSIGGAIRANYTIGDYVYTDPYTGQVYEALGRTSRSESDGGTMSLDIFRINLDYQQGNWVGKGEYRFYPGYGLNNHDGYHFPHTGWFGYNFSDTSQIQVGLNRVPFGAGAYGVSLSNFFDQHFYAGLSDDMDLGVKYMTAMDKLKLDFAYYVSDEGHHNGGNFSDDSVRYSYDVVDETGQGYEERNQFNVRAIYAIEGNSVNTDVGASLQYGMLESNGPQDDGDMMAGSVHAKAMAGNATLTTQLTYYEYDVDRNQPLGTDKLVQIGAFDFPTLLAAEGMIPAVSLSYKVVTDQIEWLDYVTPYVEYSSIMKEEDSFNDSEMFILGAAWANGGWYILSDLAYSNGNDFIGNEAGFGTSPGPAWASNRFGANTTNEWEYRFNINFGYYF